MKRFIPLVIIMVVCMFSSIGLLAGSVSPSNDIDEIPYSYVDNVRPTRNGYFDSKRADRKAHKEIHANGYVIKYNDSIIEVYKDSKRVWSGIEEGIFEVKDVLVADSSLGNSEILVVYFSYSDDITDRVDLEQHISLYSLGDDFSEIWKSPKIQSPIVNLAPCGKKDESGQVEELLCASISSYGNYPKIVDTINYIWQEDMVRRINKN